MGDATRESAPVPERLDGTPSQEDEPKQYVLERIVGHVGDGEGTRYLLRRYGYGPKDDT